MKTFWNWGDWGGLCSDSGRGEGARWRGSEAGVVFEKGLVVEVLISSEGDLDLENAQPEGSGVGLKVGLGEGGGWIRTGKWAGILSTCRRCLSYWRDIGCD